MRQRLSRRRFLCISAAAFAGAGARDAAANTAFWRGAALGAATSMRLVGISPDAARPVFLDVERELTRLEAIFSLYRPGSELDRLNATRRLRSPSPELLAVLSTSDRLNRATGGAFDPTVQPLFTASALAVARGRRPTREEIRSARELVGWGSVRFDSTEVRLERPGAALTLNGIAQGYITDRIAALLRDRGLTDVLVDMGEVAALGTGPGGRFWQAGIADTSGSVRRRITLRDRALATSSPQSTLLDPAGELGHIFDPKTGTGATQLTLVSVSAHRADVADGLSTALCALDRTRRTNALAAFPEARLEFAS